MTSTATFSVGQTFARASAGDSECIFRFTVVARTAKFVTLVTPHDETLRVGIKVDEHGEWCLPFGSYSMAPTIHAAGAEEVFCDDEAHGWLGNHLTTVCVDA